MDEGLSLKLSIDPQDQNIKRPFKHVTTFADDTTELVSKADEDTVKGKVYNTKGGHTDINLSLNIRKKKKKKNLKVSS